MTVLNVIIATVIIATVITATVIIATVITVIAKVVKLLKNKIISCSYINYSNLDN